MNKKISFLIVLLLGYSSSCFAMQERSRAKQKIVNALSICEKEILEAEVAETEDEEVMLIYEADKKFKRRAAIIVLDPVNGASNQLKLENLYGKNRWEDRKKVIRDMIEHEKKDPNDIEYQEKTPFQEAKKRKDFEFLEYLKSKSN